MPRTIESFALLLALAVPACAPQPDAEAGEAAVSPLAGAWTLVARHTTLADGTVADDPTQESLFLFTDDGYYSMGYAIDEERFGPFADPWSPTETEERERFSSLTVNGGTYEVSGSQVTLMPQFALYPVVIDSRATLEFELAGDTLALTYVGFVGADGTEPPDISDGSRMTLTLVRQH